MPDPKDPSTQSQGGETASPAKVDIAGAGAAVIPPGPRVDTIKSENIYVGYTLAKIFAGILFIYLLLALCSVWNSESRMLSKLDSITTGLVNSRVTDKTAAETAISGGTSPIQSPSTPPLGTSAAPPILANANSETTAMTQQNIELLTKIVGDRYKDTRQITVDFHKTIVVNVLFPILTGLLGYIFANRERNEPRPGS